MPAEVPAPRVLHRRQETALDKLSDTVPRHAQDPGRTGRSGPVRMVLAGVPLKGEPFDIDPVEPDPLVGSGLAEDAAVNEPGDAELVNAEDLGGLCAADPESRLAVCPHDHVGTISR